MDSRSEPLLDVGKVLGTHGLRGDLKVRSASGDPELLLSIDRLKLRLPKGELLELVPSRQVLHKGQVLLRFQGYDSINQAEQLVGSSVMLAASEFPPLEEDEYYWYQLEGMQVVDRERGPLGCLEEMFSTAAHDIYVVRGDLGEILVPVVSRYICEIDLDERCIRVDLPEELLPDAP